MDPAFRFGMRVPRSAKYGLRLSRDKYAQINKRSTFYLMPELLSQREKALFEDPECRFYTDEWCTDQRERALQNFDLNMAYFASLNHEEFDEALNRAVSTRPEMVEVSDLTAWEGMPGIYVMVLDDYCQAYVGASRVGIKERIWQHWTRPRPFDRLLWGDVHTSILSIDSFRTLDTTRIFAAHLRDPFGAEDPVIESFPAKFLLNRLRGGGPAMLENAIELGLDVVKTRDLTPVSKTARPSPPPVS